MAAINQENVSQLAGHVNSANDSFNSQLTNGVATFSGKIEEVWESERACQFAKALKDTIVEIGNSYKQNINGIVEALKTNVQNYNQFNNGSVSVPAIPEVSFDASSLDGVQAKFSDGFEGLRDGRTVSEVVEYFDQMRTQIQDELAASESSIKGSQAFDNADEQAAVAAAFARVNQLFNQSMDQLRGDLQTALSEVDESAANLTSTNTSNVS